MAHPAKTHSSALTLLDMMTGHRVTAVIHAAATLGIADLLEAGEKRTAELARLTETQQDALRRLLDALTTLGICKRSGDDAYALTAMGRHLAADDPQSVKVWAIFEGQFLRGSWGGLLDTIRSGKSAPELAGNVPERHFETMADSGNAPVFNAAMVALTRATAPGVVAAYDFAGIATLMDVGGGHGELLGAVLRAHPKMRGIVYDLPHCAGGARRHLADMGVGDRAEFAGGSFFESVPSTADTLMMKSIIHDWDDERSLTILRNCHRALGDQGKLLLVERIVPGRLERDPEHQSILLSDLNMMRGPGGRERTEAQFRDLLARGGFRLTRVFPAGLFQLIEAIRA